MIVSEDFSSFKKMLNREFALFEDEYNNHYIAGETKGPEIGAPFLLHHPDSRNAVLLIHGFMAAPYEVRDWAEDLYSKGYTVYAPRLAGHGTSAEDLSRCGYRDWIQSVNRGYEILRLCSRRIVVAGFSTGAGLALHQAVYHPERYRAVVSVSAPMKFKSFSSRLSGTMEHWNNLAGYLKLVSFQKPFAQNHPDNPEINYHRCPVHGFNQVKALMRIVNDKLPGLSIPALVVQGNRDPKVSPEAGKLIFNRIADDRKTYVEIDYHLHGIVRGDIGRSVFSAVHEFLSRVQDSDVVS